MSRERLLGAALGVWLALALAAGHHAPAAAAPPAATFAAESPPAATFAAESAPAAAEGGSILLMLRSAPARVRGGSGYGGAYGDSADRMVALRRAEAIARAHGLEVTEVWPMPVLGLDCAVLRAPPGVPLAPIIAKLSALPGVAWSQPLNAFEAKGAPVDPLLPAQPAAGAWQLDRLHRLATGRGQRIAIIDSGVDQSHPDLRGRVALARDFTGDGVLRAEPHGTAVAGVAAAAANGVGIVGIAPESRLMVLRACREPPGAGVARCDSLALARALQLAITERAGVINLSLGGPDDRLLAALIDVAVARGAVVVAAADMERPGAAFPASHRRVLAVADAPLANTLFAPGADIPVPVPGGGWRLVSGSSYAAAHVSGLAALDRQRHPAAPAGFSPIAHADGRILACRTLVRALPGAAAPGCD